MDTRKPSVTVKPARLSDDVRAHRQLVAADEVLEMARKSTAKIGPWKREAIYDRRRRASA